MFLFIRRMAAMSIF